MTNAYRTPDTSPSTPEPKRGWTDAMSGQERLYLAIWAMATSTIVAVAICVLIGVLWTHGR